LPDVLTLWRITWTRPEGGDVWIGPPLGGPDDAMLREALRYQRIEVRDGVYVMSHPWRTLNRFTWHEGDIEITRPEAEEDHGV
jgi:hypothetical protein